MKYEELDSVETINFLYPLKWSSRYKKLIVSTLPNSSYFIVADTKS
jgi:hypothetical protein